MGYTPSTGLGLSLHSLSLRKPPPGLICAGVRWAQQGSPEATGSYPAAACDPIPPTCYGQIEVLEVLDLPGALAGCETLVKGFEEVGKGQLHVGDGRPPVLAVVRPHGSNEQALREQGEADNESPRREGRCTCPPKGIGPSRSSILTNSEGTALVLN